jgi:hypothetical protein
MANAINTAINHMHAYIGHRCLHAAVETSIYTVYPRHGTQIISYKQVIARDPLVHFSIRLYTTACENSRMQIRKI